jgi:homoserine O-acetyltransferase
MIVEKKTFALPTFNTQSGRLIKNVRVGWESYGTLNADKSNAILITHYFSGTSHAAGKYAESDEFAGYWDALIVKALERDKPRVKTRPTLASRKRRVDAKVKRGATKRLRQQGGED